MKKIFIAILLFGSIFNYSIFPDDITENANSLNYTIYIEASVNAIPYYISIKYNDTDLSGDTPNILEVDDRLYKLTEESTTQPFYVNISAGKLATDTRFIIGISIGEFIGEDYKGDSIYTDIYPSVNQYENFNYSFEQDSIEKSIKMDAYLSKGIIEAQHIGAFTFSWTDNNELSSGKYTSTNTIKITSEEGSEPNVL
ncbi:MAG: hypothetical protein ACRQFF_12415 [Sphaerochaeta sp.]